ncbi:MAG: Arc family DNA-binding protein [Candidatus Omnitrophica bacterium]|nr:Arc family DNA-binding protein [Candidatus Omnitrophota bacterium]
MRSLTIKNIPDDLYSELKKSADENHRSLNSQVIVTLGDSLLPRKISPEERLHRIEKLHDSIDPTKVIPDEIRAAIHEGRP